MKSTLLKSVFVLVIGASTACASAVCTDQTNDATGVGGSSLQNYMDLGAAGCYIGNVLFASFTYSYSLGGGAGLGTDQTPGTVLVSVDATNQMFTFNDHWTVDHYQTASLTLTFTVSAPPTAPLDTLRNVYTGTANGTDNGGPTASLTATCSGGTCGPTTFSNSTTTILPTTGPITITNTANLSANGSTDS